MKLGASYNVFDGVELLPSSILAIRSEVDFISVVLQRVSNAGLKCDDETIDVVYDLKKHKLIDAIYEYDTDLSKTRHDNEKAKRDIGLDLSRTNKCTHFMSMDIDEYYDINQLYKAKKNIISKNLSATAVSIIEYLKSPRHQIINGYTYTGGIKGFYNFYCPFIFKIDDAISQCHGYNDFPCLTDPTRSLPFNGKFYLFPQQDIVMHHMSTIRKNLYEKYTNSSLVTDGTQNNVIDLQNDILVFDFEKNKIHEEYALFQDKIVKKVENLFNIPTDFGNPIPQNYKPLKRTTAKDIDPNKVNASMVKFVISTYIKNKIKKLLKHYNK